jgi:hypothetical protein
MKAKWIALSAAVVVVGAVWLLLPAFLLKDLELPKALGSLSLREEVHGEKARSIINKMHGKGVTPKDNMIAAYDNSEGSATVYLSVYDKSTQSQETFTQMVRGIEKGASPFSELRTVSVYGQPVSFCKGFGQAHYFFFIDESVYWITADLAVAEEAATELMRALKGASTPV